VDRSVALFGENLRRLIRERDITESALAQKMKMAPAQLNRYMHGQVFEVGLLTRVADALGVGIYELLLTPEERLARPIEHALDECLRRIAEAAGLTPAYLPLADDEWEEIEKSISREGVDELRRILNQPRGAARTKKAKR
jgi:transcriptional regulator with XRE-family HTH domain